MTVLTVFFAFILSLSAMFSLYKQFQMLQQNSYFPSRYLKWIDSSYMLSILAETFLFCVCSSFYLAKKYIILLCLAVIILAVRIILSLKTKKKSIIGLKFTGRIKRLYAAALIFIAVLLVLTVLFTDNMAGEIAFIVLSAFCFVSPLICLLSYLLTYPIEKAFNRYYINDAKRILRENGKLKVIGITGSFGKTTTKFILNRILSEKFNTVCTPKSFNTPLGVVRTVREYIKPSTQVFVCEMGAKKVGDIKEICDIVNPDFGLITYVGEQHLDTFKSIENVYKTKFELADAVKKNGGKTFINLDCPLIKEKYEKDEKSYVLYGLDTENKALNIKSGPFGSSFDLVLDNKVIPVKTKLLGAHSVSDILAAASLAYYLGVDENSIKVAVSSLKPTEHRLELKNHTDGSLLIDDAYNSNPVGCLEAVRVLGSFEGVKKAIITPGLIELGEKEYEANYNLGLEAAKYCDIIILVGKNRSKPLLDAVNSTDFDKSKLHIASSFAEAMSIYNGYKGTDKVVLLENDLPDNYLS